MSADELTVEGVVIAIRCPKREEGGPSVLKIDLDTGASIVLPMTPAALEFVRGPCYDRELTIRLERDA